MELKSALGQLADAIREEIIRRMHSDVGINPRTGTNTLIGSDLEKSVEVNVVGESAIVFKIADYFEYVVRGWRRTGTHPNTAHLFIRNITDWVRRKNIRIGNMTQNQIVWLLYRKMLIEGRPIAPRPFIGYGDDVDKVLPFLDEMLDKWAEETFNEIMKEIDKYFNS